jgi:hypothetical protein
MKTKLDRGAEGCVLSCALSWNSILEGLCSGVCLLTFFHSLFSSPEQQNCGTAVLVVKGSYAGQYSQKLFGLLNQLHKKVSVQNIRQVHTDNHSKFSANGFYQCSRWWPVCPSTLKIAKSTYLP